MDECNGVMVTKTQEPDVTPDAIRHRIRVLEDLRSYEDQPGVHTKRTCFACGAAQARGERCSACLSHELQHLRRKLARALVNKKVIYLAGPYRADTAWQVHQNIQRAERVAARMLTNGLVPLCPHKNTAYMDGVVSDDTIIDGCLALVTRCDALFLMEGWQESEGALKEKEHAEKHGLPVFQHAHEVDQWLHNGAAVAAA